jgi:hypothetical protein
MVADGRTSKTRNHHTLTPAWEPWGSAYGYSERAVFRFEIVHTFFSTRIRSKRLLKVAPPPNATNYPTWAIFRTLPPASFPVITVGVYNTQLPGKIAENP